jgi:hypothetical protein
MEYKKTEKINDKIIKEVLKIKKNKGLSAESILEEAKHKTNVLHDLFCWDNTKAANLWRMQQARVFINEIKIIIDSKEYYAFENVKIAVTSDGTTSIREYKSREEIITNEELRKQIIESAYSQLVYWKNKYENYKFPEFENVISEINSIKPKIKVGV